MNRVRVIPSLLIHKGGLIKSIKFKDYKYIGDPINAVKIFNDKEVDEIVILDINATRENQLPNISQIAEIASEAFMPMAYGGGITTIEQIKEILFSGVEKVIINKSAHINPNLISEAARLFGSQSIVVSMDIKKSFLSGYKVYTDNGVNKTKFTPIQFAKEMENLGAGELLLNDIERDGTYQGYNIELIKEISHAISIPLIALGGAGSLNDLAMAKKAGASAVSAGSMFVYQRPHKAVLISYPSQIRLQTKVFDKI